MKHFKGSFCELSTTTTPSPTTTTTVAISVCPVGSNICQNGGQCFVLNQKDVFCTCQTGFYGKKKFFVLNALF